MVFEDTLVLYEIFKCFITYQLMKHIGLDIEYSFSFR